MPAPTGSGGDPTGANPIDNLAESLLGSSKDYVSADNEDKKDQADHCVDFAAKQLAWFGGSHSTIPPVCGRELPGVG